MACSLAVDSAVGKDEGLESKMFSRELRNFSVSLIDPSKLGGSAICTLGPVQEESVGYRN